MTTALPCEHQHKKLVNALWCGDCGAYNELDGNNWQLPSGRVEENKNICQEWLIREKYEPCHNPLPCNLHKNTNPPSGKTLSTQNIEDIISKSDLWMSLPARPKAQQDKRHLAQAIFNAQKGTE